MFALHTRQIPNPRPGDNQIEKPCKDVGIKGKSLLGIGKP